MFQQLRNIDIAFKHIRLFSLVLIAGCVLQSFYPLQELSTNQRITGADLHSLQWESTGSLVSRTWIIFLLRHGSCADVPSSFLYADPDDKVIQAKYQSTVPADASKEEYDNLKENRYANVISGNISQEIAIDSIRIDINQYPFYFRCYSRQRLIRTTSIVTRSLVTEGYLRNVSRSDNNPHGFLIEKWNTLENKDIKTENR